MCLYYDKAATDRLREALRNGMCTYHKVFSIQMTGDEEAMRVVPENVSQRKVVSPYRKTLVEPDGNGYIFSDRPILQGLTAIETSEGISLGIHIFITSFRPFLFNGYFICPVTVEEADLVGASANGEAVFTKIKVDPVELRRLAEAVNLEEEEDWDDDDEDDDDEDGGEDDDDDYDDDNYDEDEDDEDDEDEDEDDEDDEEE